MYLVCVCSQVRSSVDLNSGVSRTTEARSSEVCGNKILSPWFWPGSRGGLCGYSEKWISVIEVRTQEVPIY
jgi:hypothetical protein